VPADVPAGGRTIGVVRVLASRLSRTGGRFQLQAQASTQNSRLSRATIYTCARRGRGGSRAGSRDKLAKLHSFLNADNPELVAKRAVRFYRRSTVEQSHQVGERIPLLQLFALAVRACPREIDR